MPKDNPLDQVATDIAFWIESEADQIADALIGGMAAPFSAHVTERDKLDYYTAQLFKPDGSPNFQGRMQEMQRLGAVGFAEVYKTVVRAHPEYRQPQVAPAMPMDLPPDQQELAPTNVPGVSEVQAGPPPEDLRPTDVPGVMEVVR